MLLVQDTDIDGRASSGSPWAEESVLFAIAVNSLRAQPVVLCWVATNALPLAAVTGCTFMHSAFACRGWDTKCFGLG